MVFSSFLPLYWLYLPSQGNNSALTGIFRRSQKEKTSTFTVSDESSPLESESQLFIPYVNHDQSWRRVATGVGQQWWRSRHCWTNVGSIKWSTVFISVLSELCEWGWAAGGKDWRCRRQKGSWEQNGVCVCFVCDVCWCIHSVTCDCGWQGGLKGVMKGLQFKSSPKVRRTVRFGFGHRVLLLFVQRWRWRWRCLRCCCCCWWWWRWWSFHLQLIGMCLEFSV